MMVARKAAAVVRYPVSFIFGGAMFVLLMLPLSQSIYLTAARMFDDRFPVVEMSGALISATDGEVILSIGGTKNRDCEYLRLQAYTVNANGTLGDASVSRIDRFERGDTKPKGRYSIGSWRIWPRGDAVRVIVYANHLCGARVVQTKIAEVAL